MRILVIRSEYQSIKILRQTTNCRQDGNCAITHLSRNNLSLAEVESILNIGKKI